jgi:hypothetical protein
MAEQNKAAQRRRKGDGNKEEEMSPQVIEASIAFLQWGSLETRREIAGAQTTYNTQTLPQCGWKSNASDFESQLNLQSYSLPKRHVLVSSQEIVFSS